MAAFTTKDKENASKFANYNDTIRALKAMYMKAPHIVSWLKIETRPATQQDYYFPDKLAPFARVITVTVTKVPANESVAIRTKTTAYAQTRTWLPIIESETVPITVYSASLHALT